MKGMKKIHFIKRFQVLTYLGINKENKNMKI